jgi:hypothetical protein
MKRPYFESVCNTVYGTENLPQFWSEMNSEEQSNFRRLFDNEYSIHIKSVKENNSNLTKAQTDWCLKMIHLQNEYLNYLKNKYI